MRWFALAASLVPFLALAWCSGGGFDPGGREIPVCRTGRLVCGDQLLLPPGGGWHRADHGDPDHPADPAGDPGFLPDQREGQGLHDPLPAAGNGHVGRVHVAGSSALLRLLGSWAGADVLPDQPVGWREAQLCLVEVHPVHHGRLARSAAGHPDDWGGGGHL